MIDPTTEMNSRPKLENAKVKLSILGDKTIERKNQANDFLAEVSNVFIFLGLIIRETFSKDFEFKEFLRQCFQIGYKSLPLISITGTIMGLVLTIQSRPVLIDFGAVSLLPAW